MLQIRKCHQVQDVNFMKSMALSITRKVLVQVGHG